MFNMLQLTCRTFLKRNLLRSGFMVVLDGFYTLPHRSGNLKNPRCVLTLLPVELLVGAIQGEGGASQMV